MELLHLAWKNLWRNRRRTLITLAAISLSVMLVQAFHNLSHGVYARMIDAGVRSGSGHLSIYRGDYVHSRDQQLAFDPAGLPQQLAALSAVQQVLPRVYLSGLAQSSRESRGILLTGVDPSKELAANPFLKQLPPAEMVQDAAGRDAVLGSRLLQELKLEPGNKLVLTIQGKDGNLVSEMFRVRGVVRTGIKDLDGSLIMIGRERAAAMAGMAGQVHELAILLHQESGEEAVFRQVQALLPKASELQLLPWDVAMPNLANAIKLDYASQKFIFVIILLIVTIGVVNTLLMSVLERLREFGLLLALGTTPVRLASLVLTEALLLGLTAMLLGTLLGALSTWYLVEVGIDLRSFLDETLEFGGVVFDPVLRATWDLPYMLQIAFYVVLLSLAASLYPARKAARLAPAEAMRRS